MAEIPATGIIEIQNLMENIIPDLFAYYGYHYLTSHPTAIHGQNRAVDII